MIIIKADHSISLYKLKQEKITLAEMQEIVGGYIEIINLPCDKVIIINEEGKLKNLPINEVVTDVFQKCYKIKDVIVGDVIFADASEIE